MDLFYLEHDYTCLTQNYIVKHIAIMNFNALLNEYNEKNQCNNNIKRKILWYYIMLDVNIGGTSPPRLDGYP